MEVHTPKYTTCVCPIYGGALADPFGTYGYIAATHRVYVLNTAAFRYYNYNEDKKTFDALWSAEMGLTEKSRENIELFHGGFVTSIYLADASVVPAIDPYRHEVLVLCNVPGKISSTDIGFIVPSRYALRSEQGIVARSWQELLNAE